jgi:hypothetical protein
MPLVTISAVGTLKSSGFVSHQATLPVSPTTLGNVQIFATWVSTSSGAPSVATVSGGGVTTWTRILASTQFASPVAQRGDVWMGPVTSTGSSTITITGSGAFVGTNGLFCQEFTCAGVSVGTLWALDGTQAGTKTNTTSTSITYPTLTPSGTFSAYVGPGYAGDTGILTGGTSGYTVQLDSNHNPFIYDGAVPNSAQSPAAQQSTSSTSATMGVLITATNPLTDYFLPFFNGY